MNYTTEGELVNLPLSSTQSGLLLCLGKVQPPQQLRCLTWTLLGVSVTAAAGVTEKCASPSAGKKDLDRTWSVFDLQQECIFVPPYVWVCRFFFSFFLLPTPLNFFYISQ